MKYYYADQIKDKKGRAARSVYRTVVKKPERQRPFERSRCRQGDDTKMHLK
jgi:hypothetical protein